jgi:hypothetical protein
MMMMELHLMMMIVIDRLAIDSNGCCHHLFAALVHHQHCVEYLHRGRLGSASDLISTTASLINMLVELVEGRIHLMWIRELHLLSRFRPSSRALCYTYTSR